MKFLFNFFKKWKLPLLITLGVTVVGALIAAIVVYFTLENYKERANQYDLATIDKVELPSIIYDSQGIEFGRTFVQNRSVISINDIPETFINALVAGEDTRYWEHTGMDFKALVRVFKEFLEHGSFNHGGSTITQQLARNAYPLQDDAIARGESSIDRKIVEIYLAQRIETHFTELLGSRKAAKMRVLELYLNRIAFGKGYYGIRAASLGYFGKEPKDLSIAECASIVGTIKNPVWKAPTSSTKRNKESRDMVLDRMLKMNTISAEEFQIAYDTPVQPNPKPLTRGTSYLHTMITREVEKLLGEGSMSQGGLEIYTTINSEAQAKAETTLHEHLSSIEATPNYKQPLYKDHDRSKLQKTEYLQGALISVDHRTGAIQSYVGGRDFRDSQYDFVANGKRPAWTAFLPFTYISGFREGQTLASIFFDEPLDNTLAGILGASGIVGEFGMETPTPIYEREIPLRKGLSQSKISASVRLALETGMEPIAKTAEEFGLGFGDQTIYRRMSMGSEPVSLRQMAKAYAGIAHGAPRTWDYHFISKVKNNAGATIYRKPVTSKKHIPPTAEVALAHVVLNDLAHGKGNLPTSVAGDKHHANLGVKTGTSPTQSDAWCVGWDDHHVTAIWTGFLQGHESIGSDLFARDVALPIWQALVNNTPSDAPPLIDHTKLLEPIKICSSSGHLLTSHCNELQVDLETGETHFASTETTEWFVKGQQLPYCSLHQPEAKEEPSSQKALEGVAAVLIDGDLLVGEDPYNAIFGIHTVDILSSAQTVEIIDLEDIETPEQLPTQAKPNTIDIDIAAPEATDLIFE